MLTIMHKGIHMSWALGLTGDMDTDLASDYVKNLVGGKVVTLDTDGEVALLTSAVTPKLAGLLVNDAAGYFYENKPAFASGKAAVTVGNCVVKSDQTTGTISVGDRLYANAGVITATPPVSSAAHFALALSDASSAAPEVTLLTI